ncbi:uncharacterized protein LOC142980151 isoform X1 [Anticarsia gemmatalis]|uniref:uncharacterized protein LOC142980151 isoform X1 n=1 Tax=Anticarsia gemmatalis TaxID=129554 RepID=UPI003F76FF39
MLAVGGKQCTRIPRDSCKARRGEARPYTELSLSNTVNSAPRNSTNALNNMSDNTVFFSRNLLKKFILLYKDLPCLWDKACISYKIKQKRNDAVDRLTRLVQRHNPDATRLHVLKKIDCLRTCFRREYKKVVESRHTATCDDEVYVPQLWYYELMSFIITDEENEFMSFKEEQSTERIGITMSDSEGEEEIEEDDEHQFETSIEHNYTTDYNSSSMIEIPDNSSKRYTTFEEEKTKRHCTEIEDEYDAIGINVAAKLRSLPANTRILAEKLINDVLFQAQTNALSTATTITTPDPFK